MELLRFYKLNKRKNLINKRDKVVLAMSGGPDSIFLLQLLLKIKEEFSLEIVLAHINHQLRGKDSERDEEFVRQLGKNHNLETFILRKNIIKFSRENKVSEEEGGRQVRYAFFNEVLEKVKGTKIALAHNEDDQVETFLFRLMRGTSLKGLEGIPIKRDKGIIRPIINWKKEEILAYLDKNNIKYSLDKTNFQEKYTRNKIRLDLIPKIEGEYNKKFKEKVINLTEEIKEINSYIEEKVEGYIKKDTVDLKEIEGEPKVIKKKIIQRLLKLYNIETNRRQVENILEIFEKEGSKTITLKNKFVIEKIYDKIHVRKKEKEEQKEGKTLEVPGETKWGDYIISIRIHEEKNNSKDRNIFILDLKEGENLWVRERKPGDRFNPKGMEGSKKVKKYLINQKIPQNKRSSIPIFVREGIIINVGGFREAKESHRGRDGRVVELVVKRGGE